MKGLAKSEFRIGNLINPTDPVKVEGWMFGESARIDFIPIPLSEEWLVKFGFEKIFNSDGYELNNHRIYLHDDYFELEYDEFGFNIFKGVKQVHRLQNIWFELSSQELTGQELKITQ